VGLKVLQIDQCSLSGVKEALRPRVIPTVARAAHAGLHPILGQEPPVAGGAILAPPGGMHDQPRCRLALAAGHR
jgi:hypothetical protein